jgi:hypothetical protein
MPPSHHPCSNPKSRIDLSACRIVQEGLTNALKHVNASDADVTVRDRPNGLEMRYGTTERGPWQLSAPAPAARPAAIRGTPRRAGRFRRWPPSAGGRDVTAMVYGAPLEPDESRRSSVIAAPARFGPGPAEGGLQRNSPGRVGSRIQQALGHTSVAAKGQPGRRTASMCSQWRWRSMRPQRCWVGGAAEKRSALDLAQSAV